MRKQIEPTKKISLFQDKCYKEICEVVGTERLPCMRDRPEMTYLEATLWEVVRKADIIPFSVQHGAAYDVRFRDYVIPKHAIIIPFQGSVLQDPEVWGDPENFRPERFIGPDGKLARPDEFIPFGIGKTIRVCFVLFCFCFCFLGVLFCFFPCLFILFRFCFCFCCCCFCCVFFGGVVCFWGVGVDFLKETHFCIGLTDEEQRLLL